MAPRRPLDFDPIAEAAHNWETSGWQSAAPGMAMVTSIMRAQQILLARVTAVLAPLGITFAQYEALALLSFTRAGQLPMGKIGARLQVHPASVTNVIDRLQAKGLVERATHPDDARTTLARITRAGRALMRTATARLNSEVFEATGLDAASEQSVVAAITDLRRHAGDFA